MDASAKNGSAFFNIYGKLYYTDIDRQLIKINDQAALDKFSEYSFKEEQAEGLGFRRNVNVALNILGVRIIKPDSSIIEIDVSESSVSITEGKSDKESYKKLAIPQLAKGDILDIFDCQIYELETYFLPIQNFPFYTIDYPALNYSYELLFGKNLTIEYRSINGAPAIKRERDNENNTVLRAETKNVMRINDVENLAWVSGPRDLPFIRVAILQNNSKAFYVPQSSRNPGIYENISTEQIIEDTKWHLANEKLRAKALNHLRKRVTKIIEDYKKYNADLNNDELADLIYTSLNFEWIDEYPRYYNDGVFALNFQTLCKRFDIDCNIGFVTSKYDARFEELVHVSDLNYIMTTNQNRQIHMAPFRYSVPGECLGAFEGEKALLFPFNTIKANNLGPLSIESGPAVEIIIPETLPEKNSYKSRMEVLIFTDNNFDLLIKRKADLSGTVKNDYQKLLVLYEDWDQTMRKYLKIQKSFIDELDDDKYNTDLVARINSIFEKDREEFSERMKQEIYLFHGKEPKELLSYSFSSYGLTKDKPQLEFFTNYILDDFIKTAGENLVMDVGKLIGEQWNPTDNELVRIIDAHLPSAKMYENEIIITIPTGYTASAVDHLKMNYSNDCMSFESIARVENDKIIINTKKIYFMSFIPKEDWHKLLEINSKANDFYSTSLVLKKRAI